VGRIVGWRREHGAKVPDVPGDAAVIEHAGDLWAADADLFVVTTSGTLNRRQRAVMGHGCALQLAEANPDHALGRPGIQTVLGRQLLLTGNHTVYLGWWVRPGRHPTLSHWIEVMALPVKEHWQERADLDLIARETLRLRSLVARYNQAALPGQRWNTVALPRPGCGNGRLGWETVRERLEPLLGDDRWHVYDYGPVA
jgi:hypothetical protein